MSEVKTYDVLVVGELNVDLILNRIDAFPVMGKEILAEDMTVTLGSSSAIFANNLSMLGTSVSYLGKVGRDQFADLVIDSLRRSGVHTGEILADPELNTGLTVALNYDNDRAMITYPGAMNELRTRDISDRALQSAAHLHVSSVFLQPGLKPGLEDLFRKAKEAGLTTSLDPQWDPAEQWDIGLETLLAYVDVFLPNAGELEQFTGCSDPEEGIAVLRDHAHVIVVKNGVKGALMWDGTKVVRKSAFLNEQVVDAIGAGDSFNAGFIHRFIQKRPLEECLELATLTGALNTTGEGGTAAFASLQKIRQTAKEIFNYEILP
ncbi:MAG: carbohydrate kinase family protein [Bacteroidales bacterium]